MRRIRSPGFTMSSAPEAATIFLRLPASRCWTCCAAALARLARAWRAMSVEPISAAPFNRREAAVAAVAQVNSTSAASGPFDQPGGRMRKM